MFTPGARIGGVNDLIPARESGTGRLQGRTDRILSSRDVARTHLRQLHNARAPLLKARVV